MTCDKIHFQAEQSELEKKGFSATWDALKIDCYFSRFFLLGIASVMPTKARVESDFSFSTF